MANDPQVIVCLNGDSSHKNKTYFLRWTPDTDTWEAAEDPLPATACTALWHFIALLWDAENNYTYLFVQNTTGDIQVWLSDKFGDSGSWIQLTTPADPLGAYTPDYHRHALCKNDGRLYSLMREGVNAALYYREKSLDPEQEWIDTLHRTSVTNSLWAHPDTKTTIYKDKTGTSADNIGLSVNSGVSWNSKGGVPYSAVKFLGKTAGVVYMIYGRNKLYRSTNYGEDFTLLCTLTDFSAYHGAEDPYSAVLTDYRTIYLVGQNLTLDEDYVSNPGIIKIHSDDGVTWLQSQLPGSSPWTGTSGTPVLTQFSHIFADEQTEDSFVMLCQVISGLSGDMEIRVAYLAYEGETLTCKYSSDPNAVESLYDPSLIARVAYGSSPAVRAPVLMAFKELTGEAPTYSISGNCHLADHSAVVEGALITQDVFHGLSAISDENGDYEIAGLPDGLSYTVSAYKAGLLSSAQFTNPVVIDGANETEKDFHFSEPPPVLAPYEENILYFYNTKTQAWTRARTTHGKLGELYDGESQGQLIMAPATLAAGSSVHGRGDGSEAWEFPLVRYMFGWDNFNDPINTKIIDCVTIYGDNLESGKTVLWFRSENDAQWKAASILGAKGTASPEHKTFIIGPRSYGVYWKFMFAILNPTADDIHIGATTQWYLQAATPTRYV